MSVYRYSDFAHSLPIDGDKTAIFNSLTLGLVIVPTDLLDRLPISHSAVYGADDIQALLLSEGGEEFLSSLRKQKLLVPIQQRVDTQDYCAINAALSEPIFGLIYLVLSDACNLRCRYCFVDDALTAKHGQRLMSPELVEQGLDLFAKTLARAHPVDEPQVILYGGEAFLNRPALEAALLQVEHLRNIN
jgi:uncharacterized protein